MLPSLGLFKSISCPLYPNCDRNPCFYSHTTAPRPSTVKDRPAEMVKRQKIQEPPVKKPLPKPASKPVVFTPEPYIPSLMPVTKPLSKPVPASAPAILNKLRLMPKPTASPSTSNDDTRKRTAHTATFQGKPTGPPTILPNVKSSIPLKVRQLIATKLYEAFARIYDTILSRSPTIATEHAKNQEAKILEATTNLAGYKQMATTTLMHLKKRPASSGMTDVGLDGDWVDPQVAAAEKASLLARANECVVSLDTLRLLEYPLPDLLLDNTSDSLEAKEMVGSIHACDRCNKEYLIKAVLDKSDLDACIYHPSRIRMMKIDGQKEKVYGCCKDPLGSVGCAQGPHVYKDTELRVLHQKTPFVQTPKKDARYPKQHLVALDCEMGYTTAGMELIRFTAVDENMRILLDELVLPSNMIIDLNTQYSGIKTLEGVKYDLDGVRKEFFKHVDQDTIIVGHGLENDMNAMRIIHTKIIDTVALFPHKHGLPYRNSLRLLSSIHLKKFIQTGTDGHDSFEDARVCIELLELYIKKKEIGVQ